MSGKLARHETAQRASRASWERDGYRTLSCSTTEVADFVGYSIERFPIVVEIKTGEGRLSPKQQAGLPLIEDAGTLVWVEHWEVVGNKPPMLINRRSLADELKHYGVRKKA